MGIEKTSNKTSMNYAHMRSEQVAHITDDYFLDFGERGKIEIKNTKVINFFRMPSLIQGIMIYSGLYFIFSPIFFAVTHLMQTYIFGFLKKVNLTELMIALNNVGMKTFLYVHVGILLYLTWVSYKKRVKIPWNYPLIYLEGVFFGLFRKKSARKLVDLLSKLFVLDTTQYSGYKVDERLKAHQIIPSFTYFNYQQLVITPYAFLLFLTVSTILNCATLSLYGTQSAYFSTAATFVILHFKPFLFVFILFIIIFEPIARKLHHKREVIFDDDERSD